MTDFEIEKDLVRYSNEGFVREYSDETKKDMTSETRTETVVIFKDKDGTVYPDGKIIKNNVDVDIYTYEYCKDEDGNVISCAVTKTSKRNGKMLDIEKIGEKKYYDKLGRVVKVEKSTRDGIIYDTVLYEYDADNNIIKQTSRTTHTKVEETFFKGEVKCIKSTTLKSKMTNTMYEAFFDKDGRIYKVIDAAKHIMIEYERDLDSHNEVISETKRFFDIATTNKKLISYVVTSYIPIVGYKVGKIIENGIVKEKHSYNLKGDEIGLTVFENGNELFTRTERTTDPDTGDFTLLKTTTVTEQCSGKLIKENSIKSVFDKDNKLLSFTQDNSIVSTYEYDEEGRRSKCTTKKLVDGEFIIINEITYSYQETEEGTEQIRLLEVFDEAGNLVSKSKHTQKYNPTTTEFVHEGFLYEHIDTDDNQ